jgi:hypothetical protein
MYSAALYSYTHKYVLDMGVWDHEVSSGKGVILWHVQTTALAAYRAAVMQTGLQRTHKRRKTSTSDAVQIELFQDCAAPKISAHKQLTPHVVPQVVSPWQVPGLRNRGTVNSLLVIQGRERQQSNTKMRKIDIARASEFANTG